MLRRMITGTQSEGAVQAPRKAALRKFRRADLEVSDKIGKGAYGGVWQATVLDTKQEVVVKVVWPDADLDPEDAKKESPGQHRKDAFKREIEMMRRVGHHPNVIAVLGATADSTVIVFEEALTDLHVIIKKQKRSLSLPIIRRCTRNILQGVEYLHKIKVVHRDLKPANILVFKDMTCKLGDFGLAREFNDTGEMTVKNEVSTLWYRAPELVMGCATYTPLIDEWSTGCILLEMLTGRCQLMGRVEDVCDCPQATHFNYNSDQLLKIFHLVGTPTDPDLLGAMHCLKHFQNWPKHKSTLENLVRSMITPSRFAGNAEMAGGDLEEHVMRWLQVATSLLQLSPAKRGAAARVLQLGLLQEDQPKPEGSTSSKDKPKLFNRVQSVPVDSSAGSALGGGKAQAKGKEEPPHLAIKDILKPSKRLTLHPFKRTAQEQEAAAVALGAGAGDGLGVGLAKDAVDGTKVNTRSVLARRPSLSATEQMPGALLGAPHDFTRVMSVDGMTRIPSSGGGGGGGGGGRPSGLGAGTTSMLQKEASLRSSLTTSPTRQHSMAKQLPGGVNDSAYDLIG